MYLASLSQDNEESLLNRAADTHDRELAGDALHAWQPSSDTPDANMYSRCFFLFVSPCHHRHLAPASRHGHVLIFF